MQEQKTDAYTIAAFVIVAIAIGSCAMWMIGGQPDANDRAVDPRYVDDGRQDERREIIDRMIERGVIKRIDVPARYPHVTVGDRFADLSGYERADFMSVILAYYTIRLREPVVVSIRNDAGDQIGTYSDVGLMMQQ